MMRCLNSSERGHLGGVKRLDRDDVGALYQQTERDRVSFHENTAVLVHFYDGGKKDVLVRWK
ncbi:MAG: hypothetical protein JWM87_112 [Candidatus Eremiobacteraeota bacterium]|nr:hypothetical protein [Candidatus Eremiobacteraeota bacterium]